VVAKRSHGVCRIRRQQAQMFAMKALTVVVTVWRQLPQRRADSSVRALPPARQTAKFNQALYARHTPPAER